MQGRKWFAAGMALAVWASAAGAQDDAKALFGARYAQLQTALEARDSAALAPLLAPGYQMTDIRGETRDSSALMAMSQRIPQGGEHRSKVEVLSAAITGTTAAVRQQLDAAMTRKDSDGQEHRLELIVVSDDTWVQSDGAWKLKASVQKDLTVRRDGEDFFHQAN